MSQLWRLIALHCILANLAKVQGFLLLAYILASSCTSQEASFIDIAPIDSLITSYRTPEFGNGDFVLTSTSNDSVIYIKNKRRFIYKYNLINAKADTIDTIVLPSGNSEYKNLDGDSIVYFDKENNSLITYNLHSDKLLSRHIDLYKNMGRGNLYAAYVPTYLNHKLNSKLLMHIYPTRVTTEELWSKWYEYYIGYYDLNRKALQNNLVKVSDTDTSNTPLATTPYFVIIDTNRVYSILTYSKSMTESDDTGILRRFNVDIPELGHREQVNFDSLYSSSGFLYSKNYKIRNPSIWKIFYDRWRKEVLIFVRDERNQRFLIYQLDKDMVRRGRYTIPASRYGLMYSFIGPRGLYLAKLNPATRDYHPYVHYYIFDLDRL